MTMTEVIGVIHLPRLPSICYKCETDIEEIIHYAFNDAKILEEQGYDGVIIENFGDYPYKKRIEDPLTISTLSVISRSLVLGTKLKIGINVLRNSGREAYSIAIASGAKFVRINSLIQTIVTDSGIIEPEAPFLREVIVNYPGIEIYADFLVKHAGDLYSMSLLGKRLFVKSLNMNIVLKDMLNDLVVRGKANKIVVTGTRTSEPPDIRYVKLIKKLSPVPVMIGSGVSLENLKIFLDEVDGFIVGSSIKKDGKAGNPIDPERSAIFIKSVKK